MNVHTLLACALGCGLAACTKTALGTDCAQDGTCPSGFACFPDFRCYPKTADVSCAPACYGAEPFCQKTTLRCVACLVDDDCAPGLICAPPIMRCVVGCSAAHPECLTDGQHCDLALGVCRGCNADQECVTSPSTHCDVASGTCGLCTPERDTCPVGMYCAGTPGAFVCTPGCTSSADCGDGGTARRCCDHRCVDTESSTVHCGFCGNACHGTEACCAGQCAETTTDVNNCGRCGKSCELPNVGGVKCIASTCSHTGCESFFGDCDFDLTNGCETNLSFDPRNCASCGRECTAMPHAAPQCVLAGCTPGTCTSGWGDCDGNVGNGCEASLMDDRQNCGQCGRACGSSQICSGGTCG